MSFTKLISVIFISLMLGLTVSCGDAGWKSWMTEFNTLIIELDEIRTTDIENPEREEEIVTEIEAMMYQATQEMENIPEKVYPEIETAYQDLVGGVSDNSLKSSLIEFYSRIFETSYY